MSHLPGCTGIAIFTNSRDAFAEPCPGCGPQSAPEQNGADTRDSLKLNFAFRTFCEVLTMRKCQRCGQPFDGDYCEACNA